MVESGKRRQFQKIPLGLSYHKISDTYQKIQCVNFASYQISQLHHRELGHDTGPAPEPIPQIQTSVTRLYVDSMYFSSWKRSEVTTELCLNVSIPVAPLHGYQSKWYIRHWDSPGKIITIYTSYSLVPHTPTPSEENPQIPLQSMGFRMKD